MHWQWPHCNRLVRATEYRVHKRPWAPCHGYASWWSRAWDDRAGRANDIAQLFQFVMDRPNDMLIDGFQSANLFGMTTFVGGLIGGFDVNSDHIVFVESLDGLPGLCRG